LSIDWRAFHDNSLFAMKSHIDHQANTGLNWISPIGSGYISALDSRHDCTSPLGKSRQVVAVPLVKQFTPMMRGRGQHNDCQFLLS
jgi:hypothetical protein